MFLISIKSHTESTLTGTTSWMYQRKQLADEGRLLEGGTHGDTNFSGSTWSSWGPSMNTAHSAEHLMCQQDSGGAPQFPSLPRCLPPSLWAQHCPLPPQDLVLSLLFTWDAKEDTEKGLLQKTSHAFLHALSISLAKLGRRTFCLKHNRWI